VLTSFKNRKLAIDPEKFHVKTVLKNFLYYQQHGKKRKENQNNTSLDSGDDQPDEIVDVDVNQNMVINHEEIDHSTGNSTDGHALHPNQNMFINYEEIDHSTGGSTDGHALHPIIQTLDPVGQKSLTPLGGFQLMFSN